MQLKSNLHFCVVEGRTIFMDEASSRYFCLPTRVDNKFQRYVSANGLQEPTDSALLAELTDLDLIERPCGVTSMRSRPIPQARLDIGRAAIGTPMLREVAEAVLSRIWSHLTVGLQDIHRVRADLDRERQKFRRRNGSRSASYLQTISQAFEQSDLVFGRSDRCLPRSVALVRKCIRAGFDVHLTIGVRINPFAAHCWVQHEETIVGDSFDIVRIYTPICAL